MGVIDDHPAVARGVVSELGLFLHRPIHEFVASHVAQLVDGDDEVDLILLDIQLRDGTDAAQNVTRLRSRGWPVLLYSQELDLRIIAGCLGAGAMGIVGKHEDPEQLAEAVEVVLGGEPYLNRMWAAAIEEEPHWLAPKLSAREREAMRLYAMGLPLKSVARRMNVSAETAKEFLLRVRRKYSAAQRPADTKMDLFLRAVEDGILPPPAGPTYDLP